MADITGLVFSGEWTDPASFPPIVSDQNQARKNIQRLHTETKNYINTTLVPAVNKKAEADKVVPKSGGAFTGEVSGKSSPLDGGGFRNTFVSANEPKKEIGGDGDLYLKLRTEEKPIPMEITGGKFLGDIPIGSYVNLMEEGTPIKFRKLANNQYGPESGVLLIRKDAFAGCAYTDYSSGNRVSSYCGSNLDRACVTWTMMLDNAVRDALLKVPVEIKEYLSTSASNPKTRNIYRRAFALSESEVKTLFNGSEDRIAFFDGSEYPAYWGTRTADSQLDAVYVSTNGSVTYADNYYCYFSPRPAFCLRSDVLLSEQPGPDGAYNIKFIPDPTTGRLFWKQSGVWVPV